MNNDDVTTMFALIFVLGLIVAFLIPYVFYLVTLQKTMNAIDPSIRPFHGALVWLAFVPVVGWIWLIIYTILLSTSLDRDLANRRIGDTSMGVTIAFVVLMGLSMIPYINLITIIPMIVLWIIHWVKMAGLRRQLEAAR